MSAIAARVRSDTPMRPLSASMAMRLAMRRVWLRKLPATSIARTLSRLRSTTRKDALMPASPISVIATRATDTSSMIERLTSRRGTARCMSNLHPERIRDNNVDIPLPLRSRAGAPPDPAL